MLVCTKKQRSSFIRNSKKFRKFYKPFCMYSKGNAKPYDIKIILMG